MANAPFPIQPTLTAITIGYRNASYIADEVAPRVPVARQEYKLSTYPTAETFALPPLVLGAAPPADRYGSRLWLLSREKELPETLVRARAYAREALAWMAEDGLARDIEVDAAFPRPGWLAITVTLLRPSGTRLVFGPWEANWQAQRLRRPAVEG